MLVSNLGFPWISDETWCAPNLYLGSKRTQKSTGCPQASFSSLVLEWVAISHLKSPRNHIGYAFGAIHQQCALIRDGRRYFTYWSFEEEEVLLQKSSKTVSIKTYLKFLSKKISLQTVNLSWFSH